MSFFTVIAGKIKYFFSVKTDQSKLF